LRSFKPGAWSPAIAIALTLMLTSAAWGESTQERLAQAGQLARAGQAAEAAKIYQQLYDAAPSDLSLRFQLAVARQMAGQFDAAAEHSRAVAAQRPEFPPAWLFLGAALLRGGRPAEAVEPLRRALSLGVPDPSAPLLLGEALLQTGEPLEAGRQFLSASDKLAENPRVWYGLERSCAALLEQTAPAPQSQASDGTGCELSPLACAYREARFAEVARQARERLAALPPSSQHFELLARDLDARGMSRESAAQWRRALELDPENRSLQKGLAAALRLSRDCESALPLIEEIQAQELQSAELRFLQGDCLLSLERAGEAVEPLRRALELDGSMLPAAGRLGAAYVKLGEHEKAVAALTRALPADADGSFHYLLARAYRALGRDLEAQAILTSRRRVRGQGP
jgi:predicted Zn-dependent protease